MNAYAHTHAAGKRHHAPNIFRILSGFVFTMTAVKINIRSLWTCISPEGKEKCFILNEIMLKPSFPQGEREKKRGLQHLQSQIENVNSIHKALPPFRSWWQEGPWRSKGKEKTKESRKGNKETKKLLQSSSLYTTSRKIWKRHTEKTQQQRPWKCWREEELRS